MVSSTAVRTSEIRQTQLAFLPEQKVCHNDKSVHDWYRFVLSYPPSLVRYYLKRFEVTGHDIVLDPFAGTGTTLVECKKLGIPSIGIEAHPMTSFACRVKVNWQPVPEDLVIHAKVIAKLAFERFRTRVDFRKYTFPPEEAQLLLKNSISPIPLAKALVLREVINEKRDKRFMGHELLAFAKTLVQTASNLRFGPEVGLGKLKSDAPVIEAWLSQIQEMAEDLQCVKGDKSTAAIVYNSDSRQLGGLLEPKSISTVITSPPYPNEKDYTRTTRLESVALGIINNKHQLQAIKRRLICSNTRTAFKHDDHDSWIAAHSKIQKIAQMIEERRVALGKTSGFERLYPRVTKLYFGGVARHLAELRGFLRPGAHLAYVVGDQASYLRVMIRTGQLIAEIGERLGYKRVGIDLFRTRFATATGERLREEVVVLRWDHA